MSSLVIKVISGQEDAERCAQAFSVAASAIAADVEVSFWLAGEAAWFALPLRAEDFELDRGPNLAAIRDELIARGSLTLCTQCAARRAIGESDVIDGIRIAGAATFTEQILEPTAKVLIY